MQPLFIVSNGHLSFHGNLQRGNLQCHQLSWGRRHPPSGDTQLEARAQQVAEEGHGMVQLHLLVVEGQTEEGTAQQVLVMAQCPRGQQRQAQAYAVVSR